MKNTGAALMSVGTLLVVVGSHELLLLGTGTILMVLGLVLYVKANKKKK